MKYKLKNQLAIADMNDEKFAIVIGDKPNVTDKLFRLENDTTEFILQQLEDWNTISGLTEKIKQEYKIVGYKEEEIETIIEEFLNKLEKMGLILIK